MYEELLQIMRTTEKLSEDLTNITVNNWISVHNLLSIRQAIDALNTAKSKLNGVALIIKYENR